MDDSLANSFVNYVKEDSHPSASNAASAKDLRSLTPAKNVANIRITRENIDGDSLKKFNYTSYVGGFRSKNDMYIAETPEK